MKTFTLLLLAIVAAARARRGARTARHADDDHRQHHAQRAAQVLAGPDRRRPRRRDRRRAPRSANQQTWTRAQIEAILPASVKQQPIEWQGADACNISRPAVQFASADVKRLITAELAHHLPADADFAILELPDCDRLVPDSLRHGRVDGRARPGLAPQRVGRRHAEIPLAGPARRHAQRPLSLGLHAAGVAGERPHRQNGDKLTAGFLHRRSRSTSSPSPACSSPPAISPRARPPRTAWRRAKS